MRVTIQLLLLAFVLAVSGCASNKGKPEPKFSDVPGQQPIVKPSDALTGKVASYNSVGRFAVLNFPLTQMPAINQTLFLYRNGLKVGDVKITGPQKDDKIVADLVNGEAAAGDEVRDR